MGRNKTRLWIAFQITFPRVRLSLRTRLSRRPSGKTRKVKARRKLRREKKSGKQGARRRREVLLRVQTIARLRAKERRRKNNRLHLCSRLLILRETEVEEVEIFHAVGVINPKGGGIIGKCRMHSHNLFPRVHRINSCLNFNPHSKLPFQTRIQSHEWDNLQQTDRKTTRIQPFSAIIAENQDTFRQTVLTSQSTFIVTGVTHQE